MTPSFVFYINGFGHSSAAKTESGLDLHPQMVVLFRNCILRSAGPDKHLELLEVIPVIIQEHLNLLMDSAESFEVSLELLDMFGMVPTSDIYDHGIPLKPGERLVEALHIFYVENNCTSFDPLDKP